MEKMARKKCKMCSVKNKLWVSENFFGVTCNKHFEPLIILKKHSNKLSEEEKIELIEVYKERFPKLFLDNTISDSDEHWHIHLSKKNKYVIL